MLPLCSLLQKDYQDLLTLKEEFSLELKQAVITGNFDSLLLLKKEITEKKQALERILRPTVEAAEAIMEKELFLGPQAVQETFGVLPENIPPIPFSVEELREAKQRGEILVLQIDRLADGIPLTGQNIRERFGEQKDGKRFFSDVDWYKDASFFVANTPEVCWKLITSEVLPNSKDKNYYEQTELLAKHIQTLFTGKSLPTPYQEALLEWEREKGSILPLINNRDRKEAAARLVKLQLNILTRDSFIEKVYQMKLLNQAQGKNVLPVDYTWTKSRSLDGYLVLVGVFDAKGARVSGDGPGGHFGGRGVSFSRRV